MSCLPSGTSTSYFFGVISFTTFACMLALMCMYIQTSDLLKAQPGRELESIISKCVVAWKQQGKLLTINTTETVYLFHFATVPSRLERQGLWLCHIALRPVLLSVNHFLVCI
mmetsp:Transcript_18536/g.63169  ORF Transcript_18536/g.63169 Transcript_18536/m.63169 type:complete len:112 (-) Transcript_18536:1256-1591(-)